MNRNFPYIFSAVLILCLLPVFSPAGEEDEIRVEVESLKGTRLSRGMAWGYIPYPPDIVFGYILAYERYGEYMPHMIESRVLERGEESMTVYQRLNFPWPVADRWYRARVDIDAENRTVSWETEEGNLKTCTGSWKVEPAEEGSKVTYSVLLDPGGRYPRFIINSLQRRSLPAVIRSLREFIKKEEKQ